MSIFHMLIICVMGWGSLSYSQALIHVDRAIYGADDRIEPFQVIDSKVLELSRSSLALFKPWDIKKTKNGYQIENETLQEKENICSDEPFIEQPAAAYCSGVLIAPDVVLTAGHCVKYGKLTCWAVKFAFDYGYKSVKQNVSNLVTSQVYDCDEVLYHEENDDLDIAVIRLDREVLGRKPVKIRTGTAMVGTDVTAIGHPLGLPQKIAPGAKIRSIDSITFLANLDTFVHNSGSPVFNSQTYELEGVLIAGEDDLVMNKKKQCYQVNRCEDNACSGETIVDASFIREVLSNLELK